MIKMALLQKDYILVDLNTDCWNWYLPYGEWWDLSIDVSSLTGWQWIGKRWWPMWSLDFTIQVNGKLKQHRTYFEMTEDDNCSQYLNIKDWKVIQEAISMLNSLWYELDIFEMQTLIENRLSGCVSKGQ